VADFLVIQLSAVESDSEVKTRCHGWQALYRSAGIFVVEYFKNLIEARYVVKTDGNDIMRQLRQFIWSTKNIDGNLYLYIQLCCRFAIMCLV
jgi:hypothetical protein